MDHSHVWCNVGLHLNGFQPYKGWCIKQAREKMSLLTSWYGGVAKTHTKYSKTQPTH